MSSVQKLVTLVIPQHQEREATVYRMLASIASQVGVDFSQLSIKIIGDGGYQLPSWLFTKFPQLDISYTYYKTACGPGYARQLGLDQAQSRYLAYLDADDCLNTVNALWKFVQVLETTGDHEVIFAKYIEEHLPDAQGQHQYTLREYNPSAAYAKWLNVAFLRQHQFVWHPQLKRAYEDTFFLDLVLAFAQDVYYLDSPTYTWLCHQTSIVHTFPDYHRAYLDQYILEARLWAKEMAMRAPERLSFDVNNGLGHIYQFYCDHPPLDRIKAQVDHQLRHYVSDNLAEIDLNEGANLLLQEHPNSSSQQFLTFWRSFLPKENKGCQLKHPTYFLTVIVPFHADRIALLAPLLQSIQSQVAFDLRQMEVVIVNDAGPIKTAAGLKTSLNIRWLNQPQQLGPGPARSDGLAAARSQYVMFCDADDSLHAVNSLQLMFQAAKTHPQAQILMAKYVNEQLDCQGQAELREWDYNFGAVYPSWFRLDFLHSYELDFHPDLHRYYEDTFFCGLALRVARHVYFVTVPICTHRLNTQSLIHRPQVVRQREFLIEYCRENYYWFQAARRRFPEQIAADLDNFVINLYYMYESYQLKQYAVNTALQYWLRRIFKENESDWQGWTAKLQRSASERTEGDAAHISSAHLQAFICWFS
ncbi:MAG: glycosyltransferase [Lactobacillus sp.]|nr:glycosyltransferase [Lactobacillus sp.]MDN6052522.1 glycosyltransferase [Lactobacillus sp.]